MLITESQMYWITRMDYINGFSIILAIIVGLWLIPSIVFVINSIIEKGHIKKSTINLVFTIIVFLVSCSNVVFIPRTKAMCAIKVVPLIVNNKEVQELPSKIVETANEWLDELKPIKKQEK